MSKNLEIMHIISAMPYGGAETVLASLIREQKNLGCSVSLCCIRERGPLAEKLAQEGIPVYLIHFRSRLNPIDLLALRSLLKRHAIKVVHTHMYRANVSGTIAAYLAQTPVIISDIQNIREWDTKRQKLMDRGTAFMKDRVTVVSESVGSYYQRETRINPQKIMVSYNAVSPTLFKLPEARVEARKSLNCPTQNVLIGMLARLVPQKDHKTFIEAARIVIQHYPETTFAIIGQGPLKSELEQFAFNLGLQRHVHFSGLRTDIPNVLAALDISVLCSRKEGFSLTILESMAAGLPVVATRVGGNEEAVVHGETGFIVEPQNPKALADAIMRLVQDERTRKKFGAAGEQRVHRYFSIEVTARKLIELYSSLFITKSASKHR